jgi:hypothetical protein
MPFWSRKRAAALRLPQDVAGLEDRGVPDLRELTDTVEHYARGHIIALESRDFASRARSAWGLVARGADALPWVAAELASDDPARIADAAGVLLRVEVPRSWRSRLRKVARSLPDGEAADILYIVLERIEGVKPSGPPVATDDLLLGGALLPFTEPIWFIEAPFDRVVEVARPWLTGLGERLTDLREPLPAMLERLDPWSIPGTKLLFVETTGGWTAMFDQAEGSSASSHLGRVMECREVYTHFARRIVADGEAIEYGNCALWLNRAGKGVRQLQATHENRWEWHAYGEPQPFEDPAAASSRRIADRLDLGRLNEYCAALGIQRQNADFYLPRGLLAEADTSGWPRGPRTQSGADWRAAHPLQ